MRHQLFLFGEAEKGEFCAPILCKSLSQLSETLGNPPEESQGIFYAIQALLYQRELIFFRVREEGYSTDDYMRGFQLLKNRQLSQHLSGICMPGVGNVELIEMVNSIKHLSHVLLILSEKDLFDLLTSAPSAKFL